VILSLQSRGGVMMLIGKKMIQAFSENEDQVVHYCSNFAEVINARESTVEKLRGWIIKDVEVFKAGTWRGITYTESDLENMVQHFKDLKASGTLDPVFKINHSEDVRDQAGWILDIRKDGDLLLADIHITEWLAYDKISDGTWKKVSAEIYLPELAEAEFGIRDHVFRAVAVVSIPKVKDIKGFSGVLLNSERWKDADPEPEGKNKDPKGGGETVEKFLQLLSELGITDVHNMTDEQKAQLNAKMKEKGVEMFGEAFQAQSAAQVSAGADGQTFTITAEQIVALSEQMTNLDKSNKDLASQVATLTKDSKKSILEKWFNALAEQGKVLPAEKEKVLAFAEKLEGEALEAYKETFSSRPKIVDFSEGGGQDPEPDETEATFAAYNEQYGQKKYD
jgi:hypothetical protein